MAVRIEFLCQLVDGTDSGLLLLGAGEIDPNAGPLWLAQVPNQLRDIADQMDEEMDGT